MSGCPVHKGSESSNVIEQITDDCAQQQEKVWQLLSQGYGKEPLSADDDILSWPGFSDVTREVTTSDYNTLFSNTDDVKLNKKLLCANGAVCKVAVEWFGEHRYTGLFRKADCGILRLATALPSAVGTLPSLAGGISKSSLFPTAALKFFRSNHKSGNFLFGGKKTGQQESFFFEHSMSTNLTEKVSFFFQWILVLFRRFSKYPTQLGLSEFASVTQDGIAESDINFPWCVCLRPVTATRSSSPSTGAGSASSSDSFLRQFLVIPENTHIFDIFAMPTPVSAGDTSGGSVQRIGKVVTTSCFVPSVNGSDDSEEPSLFFQHQRKEDDYVLRPDWKANLPSKHMDLGSSSDFDEYISKGNYTDFENLQIHH